MTQTYNGFANHLSGNYTSPPRDIWISLCPGSHTYSWIKSRKSEFNIAEKALFSTAAIITDTMKIGFYSLLGKGITQMIIETTNSPAVQNTIDKFF